MSYARTQILQPELELGLSCHHAAQDGASSPAVAAGSSADWDALVAVAMERVAAQEAAETAAAVAIGLPVSGDRFAGMSQGDISAQLSENAARAVTSGRGVAVGDGAYAKVLPVRTKHWLALLTEWVATAECQDAARAARVGLKTVLRVAADDADHADYDTGRELRTSHASVAARIGLKPDAVHRARWFMTKHGWQLEVARGRYLRGHERAAARARNGRAQLLGASVRALTTPQHLAVQDVRAEDAAAQHRARRERLQRALGRSVCRVSSRQPRSGAVSRSLQRSTRTKARKRARTSGSPHDQKTPHSRAAHRVAARLLAEMPTAVKARCDRHLGHLVEVVAPLADAGWTAYEVKDVIDAYDAENGWAPTRISDQRQPLGLLILRIRRACDPARRPMGGGRRGALPAVPAAEDRTSSEPPSSAYLQFRTDRANSTAPSASRLERVLQKARLNDQDRDRAAAALTLGSMWRNETGGA